MICFSIQLLVSLFEVVAFGSGTSTSHQMQFKKLLKEIFEVCFMAWGRILVLFAHFVKVNLKAFHFLLSLVFFEKKNSYWYLG